MSDKKHLDGKEMIRRYLEEHGFDGLWWSDDGHHGCSCDLNDFMPCGGEGATDCFAGYKTKGCSEDCGMGCEFHVGEKKEKI